MFFFFLLGLGGLSQDRQAMLLALSNLKVATHLKIVVMFCPLAPFRVFPGIPCPIQGPVPAAARAAGQGEAATAWSQPGVGWRGWDGPGIL